MRVVASSEAVAFVRERGGRLFLWPTRTRCCRSVTWRLESSTEPRSDREFRRVPADGFELYLPAHMTREPEKLEIELRRFPRRHVQGYWNGLAWIIWNL
jgi:hypothetical protein